LSCPGVTLAAGQSATVTIVATVRADDPAGVLTNPATVTWVDTDPANNPDSISDSVPVTVTRSIDLSVVKTATPDAVKPGDLITYTIKVLNNGPSTAGANEYQVSDNPLAPSGTTLMGTITAPGFDCDAGTTMNPCVGTVALGPGQIATISYQVKVNSNFTPIPGTIANTAVVGLSTTPNGLTETNLSNNTSTVNVGSEHRSGGPGAGEDGECGAGDGRRIGHEQ
ncbi:MAG: DUF11 domain-containing protein, partial [Acidobacteria bacterium]|nr:DUF11 domain-containing protein [Acidobacteriota bacterium]